MKFKLTQKAPPKKTEAPRSQEKQCTLEPIATKVQMQVLI